MPARDPNHRVAIEASPKRVRVMFNGKTVVDTLNAALILETGHMPVYYFPHADVRTDLLQRSDHIHALPLQGRSLVRVAASKRKILAGCAVELP